MFEGKRMKFYGPYCALMRVTILLLLAVTPLVTAAAGGEGFGSYSGDDAYDPAAGGRPGLPVSALATDLAPSVDCGLSAAEIAERNARTVAGGLSGDDAYDPAAGGMPELSLLGFADSSSLMAASDHPIR